MIPPVAVKLSSALVDDAGQLVGLDAGTTLLRRVLRVFPEAALVGDGPRRCDGFDLVPLELLDPAGTVVVNMDVLDSVDVWRRLRAEGESEPRVMNLVWLPTSGFDHRVDQATLALSCALFPTFANSERTATEIREIIGRWVVSPLASSARLGWVNLGVRFERVQPRQKIDVPLVLYPAIYVSERKRPRLFLDVVERVRAHTPIRVEARLHADHLVSDIAMRASAKDWFWVGPLTATREGYWEALSRTTAFLATAAEESYGLEYIEALVAGAVGIFPNLPWAHALLPEGYPFLYDTAAEAEVLLSLAVKDPEACRREVDACAGGSLLDWLQARHSDHDFDKALATRVREWFGTALATTA